MISTTSSIDNWVALGLAAVGVLYLLVVLIFPERF